MTVFWFKNDLLILKIFGKSTVSGEACIMTDHFHCHRMWTVWMHPQKPAPALSWPTCPTRAYKNVPLLFDVIIFAAGQKKFPMRRGFLNAIFKKLTYWVTFAGVKLVLRKTGRPNLAFHRATVPFLPFVPNKPEMRAGNYNYRGSCETMKKLFSAVIKRAVQRWQIPERVLAAISRYCIVRLHTTQNCFVKVSLLLG